MTKEEKRAAEASKPLEERNYWKLSKSEKTLWLNKKNLTKFNDIVLPILTPMIGIAGLILGVVVAILALTTTNPKSILASSPKLWMAAGLVVAAIGLGIAIWLFIDMKKKKKGFFINQYYAGDKSVVERAHEEIDTERQIDSNTDKETGNSGLDDLEI